MATLQLAVKARAAAAKDPVARLYRAAARYHISFFFVLFSLFVLIYSDMVNRLMLKPYSLQFSIVFLISN